MESSDQWNQVIKCVCVCVCVLFRLGDFFHLPGRVTWEILVRLLSKPHDVHADISLLDFWMNFPNKSKCLKGQPNAEKNSPLHLSTFHPSPLLPHPTLTFLPSPIPASKTVLQTSLPCHGIAFRRHQFVRSQLPRSWKGRAADVVRGDIRDHPGDQSISWIHTPRMQSSRRRMTDYTSIFF